MYVSLYIYIRMYAWMCVWRVHLVRQGACRCFRGKYSAVANGWRCRVDTRYGAVASSALPFWELTQKLNFKVLAYLFAACGCVAIVAANTKSTVICCSYCKIDFRYFV